MDGLFITKDDTITIKFVIAKDKNGKIITEVNKKQLKEIYEDEVNDASVEEHEAVFKRPNFGDTISMGSNLSTSDGVSVDFNPWSIRFARMKILLKSWTLVDGDGKPVEPTPESLENLDPSVANTIGAQLDAEIGAF